MAVSPGGNFYIESSDLVANYPATSLAIANRLDKYALNPYTDATERDFLIQFPVQGQFAQTLDDNQVWRYDGTAWVNFSGAAGAASFTNTPTGTYTEAGIDYSYITFTGTGNFEIDSAGFVTVFVLGAGGGGGGGNTTGGGGAAGSYEFGEVYMPLGTMTCVIGAGGTGGTGASGAGAGTSGSSSQITYGTNLAFIGIGGGHGSGGGTSQAGSAGGNGGGAGGGSGTFIGAGGIALTSWGFAGGTSDYLGSDPAGGGGGAGAAGAAGASNVGGNGGTTVSNSLTNTAIDYGGGGGGGNYTAGGGTAAGGGGGAGAGGGGMTGTNGDAAYIPNRGSGGGGGGYQADGGNGSSGVISIRVEI